MKKLLSLIVAAVLVLSMLPMGAMAESAQIALNSARTETIKRADEALKAPEAPSNRAMSLADALNAEDSYINLDFETEGAYPWTMLEEEGRAYGQSSNAGVSSSSSTVTATFTIDTACVLSFDYKAWGEGSSTAWDKCIFTLDGTAVFTKGAEQNDWTTYSVEDALFAGEHTIEFTYSKDSSVNPNGDYFAIDEVKLTVDESVTPTPAPTAVPDGYVGHFFETQAEVDAWQFVDNDGDGHNWTWSTTSSKPAYEGSGCVYSESYGSGAYHPDNWAISPGVTVLGANSAVSLYMASRAGSYCHEHVAIYIATGVELDSYEPVDEFTLSTGGYQNYTYSLADHVGETVYLAIRHYDCTDQYELRLDQVEFFGVEEAGAAPTPEPPTPTPEPTAVPDDFVGYYFETEEDVAEWLFLDEDGDGYTWERRDSQDYAYEGVGCITSASYVNNVGALLPDNWALSPTQTVLNADAYFSFYVAAQDPNWSAEHIGVYIGSGTDTRDYVMIDEFTLESGDYVQMSYSLADYVGEDINVALRHFDCTDQFMVNVDMFVFVGVEEGDPLTEPVEWISEVEIMFTEPAWGMNPDFDVQVPENAPYEIESVEWSCYTGSSATMSADDVFDDEEALYYVTVYLVPAEGYKFHSDALAIVNGGEEYVYDYATMDNGEYYGIIAGLYQVAPEDELEVIETIEILDFVEPVWGENPFLDVTVPDDVNYAIDSAVWYWYDTENSGEANVFDNEEYNYYMFIMIVPGEGYTFSNETVVTINGDTAFVDDYFWYEDDGIFYVWSIDFTVEREAIAEVEVFDLDVPEWGANPDFELSIPDGAHYTIEDVTWRSFEGNVGAVLDAASVFDSEELTYWLYLTIAPEDGYKFTENTTGTLNGGVELISVQGADDEDGVYFIVSISFTVEEPILWGDANGDGEVNLEDALLLMRYLIGTDTVDDENLEWCDVNGDGVVDLSDALLIMRKAMGTIELFPVEE